MQRASLIAGALIALMSPGLSAGTALPPLIPADSQRIVREVHKEGAQAVLVNVWATWCVPCREELPDLVRLERDYAKSGFRLVLVSGDFPDEAESARKFLGELGFESGSFLKDEGDIAFIDGLSPRWSGALPASFLYDGNGKLVDFWEGKASYDEIRGKLLPLLETAKPSPTDEENR